MSEEIPSFNAPQSAAWPTGKIVFTKIPIEPWKCVHDDDEEGDKDADDDCMMMVICLSKLIHWGILNNRDD